MSVLKRCRFWSLLTSELTLYNAGLKPTRSHGSFDAALALHDSARILDSLRHGASNVVDHRMVESVGVELIIDGATYHCSVEGDNVARVDISDIGSRSKGRLPLF